VAYVDELHGLADCTEESREVYLRDLPVPAYSEEELRSWLEGFGEVEDVLFLTDPETREFTGGGYVRFATHEDADGLISALEPGQAQVIGKLCGSWSLSERLMQGENKLVTPLLEHMDEARTATCCPCLTLVGDMIEGWPALARLGLGAGPLHFVWRSCGDVHEIEATWEELRQMLRRHLYVSPYWDDELGAINFGQLALAETEWEETLRRMRLEDEEALHGAQKALRDIDPADREDAQLREADLAVSSTAMASIRDRIGEELPENIIVRERHSSEQEGISDRFGGGVGELKAKAVCDKLNSDAEFGSDDGRDSTWGGDREVRPSLNNPTLAEVGAAEKPDGSRSGSEEVKSDKVFVGGLPKACTEEEMCKWFSKFGTILKSEVKIDRVTGQARGFGYVQFDSEYAVDQVIELYREHKIQGKWVEVKRWMSQDQISKGKWLAALKESPQTPTRRGEKRKGEHEPEDSWRDGSGKDSGRESVASQDAEGQGADQFDRDGLRVAAKTVTATIKEGRALAYSGYANDAQAKFQHAIQSLSELAQEHPSANWLRARINNCQSEAQKIKYQVTRDKRRGRGVHPREPVRPVGPAASSGPIKCRTRDGDEDGRNARGARGGRNSPWSARKRRRPSKGAGRR
jgi:RNA recognition motif-containing protein